MSGNENSKGTAQSQIRCEDIQELLFDYMSHELGNARSILVREHLRKCEECTRHAAEIQATLELLNKARKEETNIPSRLSDERRRKLTWWISHPLMRWIESHHMIVSMIFTIILITILSIVLAKTKLWKERPKEDVFPVWIIDKLPEMTNSTPLPIKNIPTSGGNQ